ncbi:MAG: DUF445 family protein [Planctomycetota bacterium]
MAGLIAWIGVPLLGGVIGYVTNRIAVKMIFRPIRPVSILGIKVQGLIGRRQRELAESIGRVVGDHLVQHDDVMRSFENVDLEGMFGDVLDRGLAPKLDELRSLPLIGGFLTDERVANIRDAIVTRVVENKHLILEKLEDAVEEGLDVQTMVTDKVASFQVETLEGLVLQVASRELRAIEVLGAVLGTLIGLLQVLLIWGLG